MAVNIQAAQPVITQGVKEGVETLKKKLAEAAARGPSATVEINGGEAFFLTQVLKGYIV